MAQPFSSSPSILTRVVPPLLLLALGLTPVRADPGFSNPHRAACVPGVAPELCQAAKRLRAGKPQAARAALEAIRARFARDPEQRYALAAIDFSIQLAEATSSGRSLSWRNRKPMGAAIELQEQAEEVLEAWLSGPREALPFLPSPYLAALGIMSNVGAPEFRRFADPMLAAARSRRDEDPEGVIAFTRSLAWKIFTDSQTVALGYLESALADLDDSPTGRTWKATLELDIALVYCQSFRLRAYTEAMVRTARALELLRTTPGVSAEKHARLLSSASEQVERSRVGLRLRGDVEKLSRLRDRNLETIATLRRRGPLPMEPEHSEAEPRPEPEPAGWLGQE